ncbi:MAG: hypothetical protein WA825_07865 [Steroidobacteraceae bacterium]
MSATEVAIVTLWTLLVVMAVALLGKVLFEDAGMSHEPLGVRFAFSSFALIPTSVSLALTLLSLLRKPDGLPHGQITWPLFFVGDLLAVPVAVLAAILPPYRKKDYVLHAMSVAIALAALAAVAGMVMYGPGA